MLNTNDKVKAQLENQVLLDLGQHQKTVKLPSIKTRSFSGELVVVVFHFLKSRAHQPKLFKEDGYTTRLFAIIKIRRKHLRTHMLTYQPLKKDFGLLQTAV